MHLFKVMLCFTLKNLKILPISLKKPNIGISWAGKPMIVQERQRKKTKCKERNSKRSCEINQSNGLC